MIVLHYRAISDLREQVRRAATPSTAPAHGRAADQPPTQREPAGDLAPAMPCHHP